jgi:hypothetical protein
MTDTPIDPDTVFRVSDEQIAEAVAQHADGGPRLDEPSASAFQQALAPQTPTDPHGIARMIADGTDKLKDSDGRDLLDRLVHQFGDERGFELWGQGSTIALREGAIHEQIDDLDHNLGDALAGIEAALANVHALSDEDGDAFHIEYADAPGTPGIGRDLIALLERARLDMRSAIAMNPEKPIPAPRQAAAPAGPEPQHAEHVESDAERGICRNCGASIFDGYCTNPQAAS